MMDRRAGMADAAGAHHDASGQEGQGQQQGHHGGGGGSGIEYPMAEWEEQQHEGATSTTTTGGVVYHDTNAVPRTPAGTTLHMDLKEGEVANRVLTVGDPARATRIAAALDSVRLHKTSSRGFMTYTGSFEGMEVSIISIGMGLPMADFFVRETRQIVAGPVLMVRYGTCGIVQPHVPTGGVIVATEGSVLVQRNPDAFIRASNGNGGQQPEPYLIFRPQPADAQLSSALVAELSAELGAERVVPGMNASADSFYSSQGRRDEWFEDDNGALLDRLRREQPSVVSMEMESFQILALANASKGRCIRAAAASIGVANRPTGDVCSEATLDDLEYRGGRAVLKALVRTPL